MKKNVKLLSLLSCLSIANSCADQDQVTQNYESKIIDNSMTNVDVLSPGSYQFDEQLYSLPANVDSSVLVMNDENNKPIKTQIAGKIYVPAKNGPTPLVVFLHGNHPTCGMPTAPNQPRLDIGMEYSLTGTCTGGTVPVPSFLGYEYTAQHLASHGFAVISIDANRGITGLDGNTEADPALNVARGRLVLRHLQTLKQWQSSTNSPLSNVNIENIDFSNVGLVGHSRGGEGVRAAYNLMTAANDNTWRNRLPQLKIQSIFEIAPVDLGIQENGKQRNFEANGIPWTVLLAGCDQDLKEFQGTKTYRRMLDFSDGKQKAIYTAWGANHNFFNTEWQVSEAGECVGTQKPLWNTQEQPIHNTFSGLARKILDYFGVAQDIPMERILELLGQSNARLNVTGSEQQRNIAKGLIYSFFKANLDNTPNAQLNNIFDPQYRLPTQLSQQSLVSRELIRSNLSKSVFDGNVSRLAASSNVSLKSFSSWIQGKKTEKVQSLAINPNDPYFIYDEAPIPSSSSIEWNAGPQKTVDIDLADFQQQDFWTLDFVLGTRKACRGSGCVTLNPLQFDIAVETTDGQVSSFVNVADYVTAQPDFEDNFHYTSFDQRVGAQVVNVKLLTYLPVLMNTVRIELKDFGLVDSNATISKVKIRIPADTSSQLVLDEIYTTKRN